MKIIKINRCEDCFYVRNLAKDDDYPYCCMKTIRNNIGKYKIKNTKRIPWWCPLENLKEKK